VRKTEIDAERQETDVHARTISRAFFTEEASCDGMARVEKQEAEGLDWHETKNKGGVTPSFGTLDNSLASEDINSPN